MKYAFVALFFAAVLSFSCKKTQSCIDTSKIDYTRFCGTTYDPVCGCDDFTYNNACEAERSGVVSWIGGPCFQWWLKLYSLETTMPRQPPGHCCFYHARAVLSIAAYILARVAADRCCSWTEFVCIASWAATKVVIGLNQELINRKTGKRTIGNGLVAQRRVAGYI